MQIIITLPGTPRTKKNSQRIVERNGKPCVIPSKAYEDYCNKCLNYLRRCKMPKDILPIKEPVNVQVLYYMPTNRRVDLPNLLNATDDILVDAGILEDDNSDIIMGHDGSRVYKGEEYPRAVVYIQTKESWDIIIPKE